MSKARQSVMTMIASAALLVACAGTSSIRPANSSKSGFDGAVFAGETSVLNSSTPGVESYRLFQQAATGFVSLETVRASTEKRATEYCARSGAQMRTLSERTSTPPHILGNFPRVEIVFECADVARKAVTNDAGTERKFAKLAQLKTLLDDGALTKSEFDREKAKILSEE